VDGRRVSQNELDRSDIDAQRYRPASLSAPVTTELDKTRPVEFDHLQFAEFALQHIERRSFGTVRRLADGAHVGDMKVDEVAEGFEAGDTRGQGSFASIDPRFRISGPASGVVAAQERLVDIATLMADLDPP